jgi:hypothetical protein
METDIRDADRVRARTARGVREEIDRRTEVSVARYRWEPRAEIARRIERLDEEWDVDRALMANLAIVGGLVFAGGIYRMRRTGRWNGLLTFFAVQLGFMAWHSAVGWCPPLPVFRRLGFRTQREILAEREALEQLLVTRSR